MIRFDRDVLREGERPDIVVIEFAVNDEGDETKGVCYESLVRKVLKLPGKPAVVLLFSGDLQMIGITGAVEGRWGIFMIFPGEHPHAVTPQFH